MVCQHKGFVIFKIKAFLANRAFVRKNREWLILDLRKRMNAPLPEKDENLKLLLLLEKMNLALWALLFFSG